ncbi:MAG: glycosyltransferase [Candidatus Diapherotrites archaeon]|nr:glycosyltransferase [Candidatus Diapherotrites archaeon]
MPFKVSAIVPTRNRASVVSQTVDELLNQTVKFHEILVVDDKSTDATVECLKKKKGVKVLELEKHLERSAARNFGARHAKGDYMAFIEDDSSYDLNWLEEVKKELAKGAQAVIDRRQVFEPKSFVARLNDAFFTARYRNYTPFSAWVFDKKLFLELGGFDESLNCAEDKDLGDRALAKGVKIHFAHNAVQRHRGEPSSWRHALKRSWWFGMNMHKYWKKHPGEFRGVKIILFTAWALAGFSGAVSFIFWPLLGLGLWGLFLFAFLGLWLGVFVKDLGKGLSKEFIFNHAWYVIVTETVFVWAYNLSWFKRVIGRTQEA